ncbi:MAG TPA: lysylphosphatidylglycerol synthase transmembrane domain-containing protein, partial [Thermoleophilaceae bacterium]|nr:lysylphosphatidylglycerol synthase transmembrane domain-containing protein [Thermoleophilaceae bacterium]
LPGALPSMNRRFALIQAIFSLVALAAVVWWASKQDAPELPSGATAFAWLGGAVALYALATILRGERWHRILHLTGVRASRTDSYALTTVGYMGNNVLPARAGEMLRVVLLSKRSDAGKRELLGTVVGERALDALALGVILVVVVFAILRDATLPSQQPLVVAGVGLVVLAAGLGALQLMRKRGMLTRFRDWVRPLADAPRALLGRYGVVLLVGSFLIWATEASVYLAVANATSLDVSFMGALYLVALTNLFAMLPAAPGYVGTFDAAVVYGVHAIGGSKSAALSYLILLRFILFVPITVVGLIVLVTRYGGWSRLRSAIRIESREPAPRPREPTPREPAAAREPAI